MSISISCNKVTQYFEEHDVLNGQSRSSILANAFNLDTHAIESLIALPVSRDPNYRISTVKSFEELLSQGFKSFWLVRDPRKQLTDKDYKEIEGHPKGILLRSSSLTLILSFLSRMGESTHKYKIVADFLLTESFDFEYTVLYEDGHPTVILTNTPNLLFNLQSFLALEGPCAFIFSHSADVKIWPVEFGEFSNQWTSIEKEHFGGWKQGACEFIWRFYPYTAKLFCMGIPCFNLLKGVIGYNEELTNTRAVPEVDYSSEKSDVARSGGSNKSDPSISSSRLKIGREEKLLSPGAQFFLTLNTFFSSIKLGAFKHPEVEKETLDRASKLNKGSSKEDWTKCSKKIEEKLDQWMEVQLSSLEAGKSYPAFRDKLDDIYTNYNEAIRKSNQLTDEILKNFISAVLAKLSTHRNSISGCNVDSNIAVNSPMHTAASPLVIATTQIASGRAIPLPSPPRNSSGAKFCTVPLHLDTDDFNFAGMVPDRLFESDRNSPVGSMAIDLSPQPLTARKKESKKTFNLALELVVKGSSQRKVSKRAHSKEVPKKTQTASSGNQAPPRIMLPGVGGSDRNVIVEGKEVDISGMCGVGIGSGTGAQENSRPIQRNLSSENYQDNSPSVISLLTRDDKNIIKDRVASYNVLMRNARYLKNFLKDLPLKKQERFGLIECFYFETRSLLTALEDSKQDKNPSKILTKVREMVEQLQKKTPQQRKIFYRPVETMKYLCYLNAVPTDALSTLTRAYDSLDDEVGKAFHEFEKNKSLSTLVTELSRISEAILNEKKLKKSLQMELQLKRFEQAQTWKKALIELDISIALTGLSETKQNRLYQAKESIFNWLNIYYPAKAQEKLLQKLNAHDHNLIGVFLQNRSRMIRVFDPINDYLCFNKRLYNFLMIEEEESTVFSLTTEVDSPHSISLQYAKSSQQYFDNSAKESKDADPFNENERIAFSAMQKRGREGTFSDIRDFNPLFVLSCAEVFSQNNDIEELIENLEVFEAIYEGELTQYKLAILMDGAEFGEEDIAKVWAIHQKHELSSPREIEIKEDLELFADIKNADKLLVSLKNSSLLEFCRQKASPINFFFNSNHDSLKLRPRISKATNDLNNPSRHSSFRTFADFAGSKRE